jgi:hypothetical protein
MFQATFCPSSGAPLNTVVASCSRIKAGIDVFPAVVCLLVTLVTSRPRLETHPPQLLYGNRRLRLQFKGAPDDGQNVAPKHVEQR